VRAVKSRRDGESREAFSFTGSELVPRAGHYHPHDPIYVIAVDKRIIPNHDDIATQPFITFLREFIFAFATNPQGE